ncbi:MAG: hypothetical protein LBC41_17720, partial [Clostridiales bacterium]|nr:hypothetical protein [Clostridiales bacterium]
MHSKFKVINKTLAFLLALVFAFALMPVVTTSASQAGIATSPPDYDLPVGGVLPFVPLPLSPEEAEDIPVLVKGKKKSLLGPQAYVAPSVPGGTNYGYEWLRTASDSTINDNRSILLGLYESFVEFSDKTYSSTGTFADMDDRSDLVTNGSVDATSLGLKVDVSGTSINTAGENSKKTIALLNLAWSSFIYDNPQYYLFDTFWLFKASGGPSIATLTAFIPTISAEYKTYAARQSLNALIESKYQEYAQLAGTVSTEYEKARIVHDKILAERDYSFVNNNPDTNAYAHNILGVMDTSTRGPVCEAYAEAYAYILHRLGIEASVLVGKASSGGSGGNGGHAWNIVKIGNAYYYADPTWDDCETIGLSGKYNDSGNEKNIMHYNYFLVGTGDDVNFGTTGTQVFTASHAVADHSGENGYYLYGLPAIADSKSSISPSTKTWINSFLQRGDIFDNYFIAFTNKRTDQLGSDSTALFTNDNGSNLYDWNAQNNRSFGAYTVDSHSTDIAVNAPMYKWVYNKTGTDITTIFPSSSPVDSKDTYDIVVEKPYKSGKNRAWTYGKGNYAGLDFGMVTLSFADATATVADATISGNTDTGLAAGQTATLTLANASVARTGLSDPDASSWFTGLPPGISVTANGVGLSKTITLSFSGTPESAST